MKRVLFGLASILSVGCADSDATDGEAGQEPGAQPTSTPNILFLFADQHNADAMSCAGNAVVKTATLDALASAGVRFENAYCQAGISVASRTSLFTGQYPRTVGALDNSDVPLNQESLVTMNQLFQANGYKTGCFGKRHLGKKEMSGGWDYSATVLASTMDPSDETYYEWLEGKGLYETFDAFEDASFSESRYAAISPLGVYDRESAYIAETTKEFLKERGEDGEPFFVWATFNPPHQPYTPPQAWADLYPIASMPLPSSINEPYENLPYELQVWRKRETAPWNLATAAADKDLYRKYISYYYAQVHEVDFFMGEIIKELEEQGLADNTIIIYSSDHGDFVSEHGMIEKCAAGHNVYDATLRVPMIVSWPGVVREGVVSNELVGLIDIYPTLIEFAGLNKSVGMQELAGESLVSCLKSGASVGRDYIFSESWDQLSIIGRDYKLGVWMDTGDPTYVAGTTADMLFDHNADKGEMFNKIDDPLYDQVETTLRAKMNEWLESTSDKGRQDMIEQYYGVN